MKMPTVMAPQHKFSAVPTVRTERSVFDRSHAHKTTFDAGYLIPFYVDWALPGDTFNVQVHAMARLSTPMKPVLDNLYLETFFFAVPYRLIWANFVKMFGEQEPSTFTVYTIPITTVPAAGYNVGSVEDYMGIPTGVACTAASWTHSALPVRAYALIYDQWFRDENLVASMALSNNDGPLVAGAGGMTPRKRGKRHDYFTSCLPWTQKGTAQAVPLSGVLPVYVGTTATAIGVGVTGSVGSPGLLNNVGANNIQRAGAGGSQLLVDLSGSTNTINTLRQAFQVQKYLEALARGGSRYTEWVRVIFNVVSPDARLQRAEYLGGGSTPLVITAVAQTSATTNVTPAAGNTVGTQKDTTGGNLTAYGTAAVSGGHGFVKSFTEHCIIIGLVNVRADLTYQQGLYRMWSHSTQYDHFLPQLAHIGEQAVLNQEIYLADNAAQNIAAFGYQERYAEYRYKPSLVTGKFRSSASGSLDLWHLSENFGALPTLGQTFIEDQTSTILNRILAVSTEPDVIGDFWFNIKCARPMPVYGVPGLIDHF